MKKSLFSSVHGNIYQVKKADALDILEIEYTDFSATVSLYGGQVLTWQLKDQHPIFWLSDTSKYQQGQAIRGGIPICWPWFGSYKNGGNHGFAREMQWQLKRVVLNEKSAVLELETSGENLSPLWPTPFKLSQTLTFSTEFKQQLTMYNLSDHTVDYSSALHSYFRVSSPENISIARLNNIKFDDKNTLLSAQQDELANGVGPIDRIYYSNQSQQIIDLGWQRIIEVESTQCQQWVLWNPGKKVAEQMADVHDGGEAEFICLEAANTQWKTLLAHENITLEQKVSINQL